MIPPAINDKSNLSRGATCRLWWIVWATPIPPHAGSSFSRRQKIKLISIEQSCHFCQRSTCKLVLARFIRSSYSQVIWIVSTANTKRYLSWHRAVDLVHPGLLRWIGVNQSQIIDMCRRRNNDLINTTWTFRRQNWCRRRVQLLHRYSTKNVYPVGIGVNCANRSSSFPRPLELLSRNTRNGILKMYSSLSIPAPLLHKQCGAVIPTKFNQFILNWEL